MGVPKSAQNGKCGPIQAQHDFPLCSAFSKRALPSNMPSNLVSSTFLKHFGGEKGCPWYGPSALHNNNLRIQTCLRGWYQIRFFGLIPFKDLHESSHEMSHEGVHGSAHESVQSSGRGSPVLFSPVLFVGQCRNRTTILKTENTQNMWTFSVADLVARAIRNAIRANQFARIIRNRNPIL